MYKYKVLVSFKHKNNIGNNADYSKVFTITANDKTSMIRQLKKRVSVVLYDLSYGDGSYRASISKIEKFQINYR